jgi:hypothetical protein
MLGSVLQSRYYWIALQRGMNCGVLLFRISLQLFVQKLSKENSRAMGGMHQPGSNAGIAKIVWFFFRFLSTTFRHVATKIRTFLIISNPTAAKSTM